MMSIDMWAIELFTQSGQSISHRLLALRPQIYTLAYWRFSHCQKLPLNIEFTTGMRDPWVCAIEIRVGFSLNLWVWFTDVWGWERSKALAVWKCLPWAYALLESIKRHGNFYQVRPCMRLDCPDYCKCTNVVAFRHRFQVEWQRMSYT